MMSSAGKNLVKRIAPSSSMLFICDIQEIFRGKIWNYPALIQGANTLMNVAQTLEIPTAVTTQYCKRFGPIVPELQLDDRIKNGMRMNIFDKTLFSMMTPEVTQFVHQHEPKSIIICGIEAHVCVQQTCLDLLEQGYDVHLVADAVSSQRPFDRQTALGKMVDSGASVTTLESLVFEWMRDSKHPKFKEISKLLKDHAQVCKSSEEIQEFSSKI